MLRLVLLFLLTFLAMLAFCGLMNVVRRRSQQSHQAGGCHETGAATCCRCTLPPPDDSRLPRLPLYRP